MHIPWCDPEVAWAAGLFEGEGTITQSGGQFNVQLKNTDEEVVYGFAAIVRFGEVYGPYKASEKDGYRRKPFGAWVAREYGALEVLEMLWPWLSGRRKGQAMDIVPMEAILLEASKNT